MKRVNKMFIMAALSAATISMTACANSSDVEEEVTESVSTEAFSEASSEATAEEVSESSTEESTTEGKNLYRAFADDEVPAIRIGEDGKESTFMFSDLPQDPYEWDSYSIEPLGVDLDNDGDEELILKGPYGGMYIDVRDDKVYVLAEGEGTTGELSYTSFDGETYIVHRDTSHGGRQVYWFDKYNGKGEVEDSFTLSAEYWDSEDDHYNENSDFTFRDKKITMEEYESLVSKMLGN